MAPVAHSACCVIPSAHQQLLQTQLSTWQHDGTAAAAAAVGMYSGTSYTWSSSPSSSTTSQPRPTLSAVLAVACFALLLVHSTSNAAVSAATAVAGAGAGTGTGAGAGAGSAAAHGGSATVVGGDAMKQHVDEVAAAGSPPAAASSSKQGKGKRSKKRRKKRSPKASSKKKSKAKSSKTAARQPPATTTAQAPAASPPPAAPASPQTLEPPQPPVELRDEGVHKQSPPAPPHSASPAADDTASVASAGTPSPTSTSMSTDAVGGEADAVPPSDGGAAPGEAQVQSDGSTSIISSSSTIDANDVDAAVAVQEEGDVAGSPQHVLFVSLALRSHATPLLRLAREMVRRGYRVTFAINDEGRHWVNATGASFLSTGPLPGGDLTAQLAAVAKDSSTLRGILALVNQLYLPADQRPGAVVHLRPFVARDRPALVVVDVATAAGLDVALRHQLPVVVNNPTMLFLGDSPSSMPAWGTGFSVHTPLTTRCMNIVFPRLLSVALTPAFMRLNKMRWSEGVAAPRSQHDIYKGMRVLYNAAWGLDYPRRVPPLMESVGPILPAQMNTQHLPESIAAFLAPVKRRGAASGGGASKRAQKRRAAAPRIGVYLRLGSSTFADPVTMARIIEGLSGSDMRVLWAVPRSQLGQLPAEVPGTFHVQTSETTPHFPLLASPAITVVVTGCGLGLVQEALYFYKPVVCIPFLADQADVAARVVDAGAGLALDKTRFEASDLRRLVMHVHGNASVIDAAWALGRAMRRAGGVHRAADVLESEMMVGSQHLMSAGSTCMRLAMTSIARGGSTVATRLGCRRNKAASA